MVKGWAALCALFDGSRIHCLRHVILHLTATEDYTVHELGWRVRQWLSAVDG